MIESFIQRNIKKILQIYCVLLMGVMPFIVTPWSTEVFYNYKLAFTILITLIMYFILKAGKNIISFSWLDLVLLVYAVLIVMSTIFSIDFRLSLLGTDICREGLVSLLTYLLIFNIFKKHYVWSEKTFHLIFICSAFISVYGILQYFKIVPEIYSWKVGRDGVSLSTIGNRNFVGSYCTLFLPFTLWRFLKKGSIIHLFYSVLLLGLLLSSMTRSAWLAFAVYFPLLLAFGFRDKAVKKRWLGLASVIFIAFCFINLMSESALFSKAMTIITDASNIRDSAAGSYRIHIWRSVIPLLNQRLVLGSGPDTFGIIYSNVGNVNNLQFPKVHNEYLQIALTTGLPSFSVYLIFIGMALYRIVKKLKIAGMQALFCSIIGYLIQMFFNISVISVAPIYWAFLGLGARETDENIDV